jgi:aromatic-L-amino-acid/L-tryptophan decarboxylase
MRLYSPTDVVESAMTGSVTAPAKELPGGRANASLDPPDWCGFRRQAHQMLDDILEYLENIRDRPVWQPIPATVRERFRSELPWGPSDLAVVHQEFTRYILPFAAGNVHPGFMGWVHGAGTPVGVVAEMLAAGLNANLGGRDHIPIEVERELVGWMRKLFGFPESASGLFVTGASMANLVGVLIARDVALGFKTRCAGVAADGKRLTAYASSAAHACIAKALDIAGIGTDALRRIGVDGRYRIDLDGLQAAIDSDRRAGFTPFLLVGTAGTVDTGSIDDLEALANLARREDLWFHVDGALGALAMLAPGLAPLLKGIERADSLAFDFHKWGQVPYDAGFVLVRDGRLHRQTFAASTAYLKQETRGLAAGSPWPCDFGPDLSRGFRALKTWFTFKVHGAEALGASIARSCELARYLEKSILQSPDLELAAPVELNIVCFRFRARDADRVNARIVTGLQESGAAAPSTSVVGGRLAIRAAIVNHRTTESDLDTLVERTLLLGRALRDQPGDSKGAAGCRDGRPPRKREEALRELEARIAANPEATPPRLERARLLFQMDRSLDARNEYLEILAREPFHRVALNNLGALLNLSGHRTGARIAFTQAAAHHPGDPMSCVNLANLLYEDGELHAAREHYEAALRCAPDLSEAHLGFAHVLADLGDAERAARHRHMAFKIRAALTLPYRGDGPPLPVLKLISAVGGNVPTRHLLDDRVFETTIIAPEFYDLNRPLPPHRLIFNAIGDPDLDGKALEAALSVAALSAAPVLNAPRAVMATGRAGNARRLSRLPGVITPAALNLPRELLSSTDGAAALARHGLGFPLLLRTPGFHTGRHFVQVDRPEALAEAVAALPGAELIALQYLDARGADGNFRKYRAMTIDGRLYPLHLAISSQWKVHYFSADMTENMDHRTEERDFLENMPAVLGSRAMAALEQVQMALGLDYGGIDFGLGPSGDLLLFEANATMVVNPPESGERWDYRRQPVHNIFAAVRRMLLEKARITS